MVRQGEIVEVDFRLPDDSTKKHPALVVSNVIHDAQGDFIYAILISSKNINPQYTIEITPDMLTKPMVNIKIIRRSEYLNSYDGKHLVSTADANVWQLGVYGREDV